ncbi:9235_t:CDS:1, partial [Ambispora leptoticha]
MHPLTESQRGEIIGLYKNKQSVPKISRVLKVYRATVTRTIAKYLNGDDLTTRPQSGHPKLLTNRSQKILKTIVKNNNKKSAK